MGLFSKKDPCAICGGKVSGIFPKKIGGQLICKSCYGTPDLPDDAEKNMTVEDYKRYLAFQAENQKLRDGFAITNSVDLGFFGAKVVVDATHGLFSFSPELSGTIFYGNELKSVLVKEDNAPLYVANSREVVRHRSNVPDRVTNMIPAINDYIFHRHMHDMAMREQGPGGGRSEGGRPGQGQNDRPAPPPPRELPKPVNTFVLFIEFNHPYWGTRTFTMGGPGFDSIHPDANDYMREYNDKVALLESFVMALSDVAFPNARHRNV